MRRKSDLSANLFSAIFRMRPQLVYQDSVVLRIIDGCRNNVYSALGERIFQRWHEVTGVLHLGAFKAVRPGVCGKLKTGPPALPRPRLLRETKFGSWSVLASPAP